MGAFLAKLLPAGPAVPFTLKLWPAPRKASEQGIYLAVGQSAIPETLPDLSCRVRAPGYLVLYAGHITDAPFDMAAGRVNGRRSRPGPGDDAVFYFRAVCLVGDGTLAVQPRRRRSDSPT